MATLGDTLKKLRAPKTAAAGPSQGDVQQVARQASSGKVRQGTGPRASSVGQQNAVQQGQAALNQQRLAGVQTAGSIQQGADQTAAQQDMAGAQQNQQFNQAKLDMAQQGAIQSDDIQANTQIQNDRLNAQQEIQQDRIMNSADQELQKLAASRKSSTRDLFRTFKKSNQELSDMKDAAKLEQVAQNLAMSDRDYLQNLQQIGKQQQLTNDAQFAREAQNIAFGQNLSAQLEENGFNMEMAGDQHELEKYLSQLDDDLIRELGRASIRDAAVSGIITGAGSVAE